MLSKIDAQVHEKPLSIALREIDEGLLTKEASVPVEANVESIADIPATDEV